jgi:hypothetical protein
VGEKQRSMPALFAQFPETIPNRPPLSRHLIREILAIEQR